MPPPAPMEEPAPVDPSLALDGLEDWPRLSFGFAVEPGSAPDGLRLTVAMSFHMPPSPAPLDAPAVVDGEEPAIPAELPAETPAATEAVPSEQPAEPGASGDPAAAVLERYRTLGAQWEPEAGEVEVTLECSFCAAPLAPAGAATPQAILRENVRAILHALEKRDGPEAGGPIALAPLSFALPDPVASAESYAVKWLQPLLVTLRFARVPAASPTPDDPPAGTEPAAGLAESATGAAAPEPAAPPESPAAAALPASCVTPIPPLPDTATEVAPPAYAGFATAFEATLAGSGRRVMIREAAVSAAGDIPEFFLLRWQVADGLHFTLREPAAHAAAGWAGPLISRVRHTRADISPAWLPAGFPARFARTERLSVQDHDLDAELARFLGEVEGFLSPGRRTSAAIVEPVLVGRCVAAREVLANLLSERLVAIDPSDPARPAASTVADEAACAALREACRRDLRNFHRLGAIAGLQVEPTASQPVILHGRFVPKAGAATEVLSGANRRTAAENVLAFPLLVDDGDRGQEIRLPGAFCCDAIELTDASSVATAVAGDRFHFVSDAGTSVEAPTLRVRVPVRALPRPPELLRVAAIALEGSDIAAAKSWRLECDYRCEALAQDTLRFDLASELPRVEATAAASPDLLDALVVFRAHLPAIAAVLERTQAAPAAIPDPIVSEAIRGFVMLVEEVARHFRVPAVPGLDAGAESEERREMTPEPGATLVAGPFDVTRRQQAGCSVQIVRNLAAGLSPAFHYPTPVVRAATPVRAFVDRTLDLDLATLPRLEVYMPDGPAPGSLVDCLTRLLRAVLDAPGERETLAPVTVSLRVEFACRPAGMGDDGPLIRLPVAVVSPRTISPVRRLLEMRAWAQPIAAHLEHWLAQNDPRTAGGFERAGARFLFDFMLGSVGLPGASGDPWLRWSGLYFRCADPA